MKIRRAVASDVADLVALYQQSFDHSWPKATLSHFIETDHVLVSCDPGEGFIIIRQTLDEAEIITLAVAPTARNRGLGSALLAGAWALVADQGAHSVFLEVASDNAAALALYNAAGFTQIGRRKGYYARTSGTSTDALVMSRRLEGAPIVSNS